jgi:hypothetical protein
MTPTSDTINITPVKPLFDISFDIKLVRLCEKI